MFTGKLTSTFLSNFKCVIFDTSVPEHALSFINIFFPFAMALSWMAHPQLILSDLRQDQSWLEFGWETIKKVKRCYAETARDSKKGLKGCTDGADKGKAMAQWDGNHIPKY